MSAWLLSASVAQAQPNEDRAPVSEVAVSLRATEPKVGCALYQDEGRREVLHAICGRPATGVRLGGYRIEVWRAGDGRPLARNITVRRPVVLEVTPKNLRARRTGLTLGVLGIPTIVGGVTLYGGTGAIAWGCAMSEGQHCPSDAAVTAAATAGATIALTGFVMTTVGWLMFGANRRPRVRALPSAPSR